MLVRKAKAQDCKAIPRHAVRRCITNNYSPSDRRNYTQNGEKTRRYRDLQSATTKRHFPHLECGRAKCLQIEFGGAKPRQPTRITIIFNERASESINYSYPTLRDPFGPARGSGPGLSPGATVPVRRRPTRGPRRAAAHRAGPTLFVACFFRY